MNQQGKKVVKPKVQPKQQVATGPFHFKGNTFHIWLVLSVVVLCFTLYGNSISNGFSLDDEFVIRGDTTVQKGVSAIPQLFKQRYAWDQKGSYGYRPLVKASFALEYQFFGRSPHVGHAINILLYASLCIFIFYFFRKLFYDEASDYFLLLALALFIAHPMHTEVVDSLKNRDILLSCLLGFYSSYAFIKGFGTDEIRKRVIWIVSAVVAFDLAFLSKPDALVFAAITPLILFFFDRKTYRSAILSVVFILVGVICLRFIEHHLLPKSSYHRTYIFIEQPLMKTHWYQRITLGFYSIWFYTQKLIFPVNMSCYYGYKEIEPRPSLFNLNVLAGLLVIAILLFVAYRNKEKKNIILFTVLFFAGTMFTYSNVVKVGPGIVADRFTFIPSLGFILLVVFLVYYLLKLPLKNKPFGTKAQYIYGIVLVTVIVYSGRTIARNPDWKSHLNIYEHDAKVATNSAKLQSLLASAYIQHIQEDPHMTNDQKVRFYQLGEAAYMASINIYPEYATSLNNLGMIQFNFYRNYTKALDFFTRAVNVDSNYTEALFNIGATYQALGDNNKAEHYLLRSIQANPEYYMAYISLTRTYFNEGRVDKVIEFNQNALDHGHVSDAIYVNLGNAYLVQKDTLKAVDYFRRAVAFFNKNYYLCQFLTKYYSQKGDMQQAEYYGKLAEAGKEQSQRPPESSEQ